MRRKQSKKGGTARNPKVGANHMRVPTYLPNLPYLPYPYPTIVRSCSFLDGWSARLGSVLHTCREKARRGRVVCSVSCNGRSMIREPKGVLETS